MTNEDAFEKWWDEYTDYNDIELAINYGADNVALASWQAAIAYMQEHDNQLIEKCAIVCDELDSSWAAIASMKIRALKASNV